MRETDERTTARQQFSRQSRKARRRQMWALPLLAAVVISLSGFLWFAFTGPVQAAKPALSPSRQAPSFVVRVISGLLNEEPETGADLAYSTQDAMTETKPYTLTQDGLRVIFLQAQQNAAWNEQTMLADIEAARAKYDVVGINLRWGEGTANSSNEARRQLAHSLIDGGADVIVGYGQPQLQGVEIYENGLILYSLGNGTESIALELKLTSLGWQSAAIIPLGEPAARAAIRERVRSFSTGLGATLTLSGEQLEVKK